MEEYIIVYGKLGFMTKKAHESPRWKMAFDFISPQIEGNKPRFGPYELS